MDVYYTRVAIEASLSVSNTFRVKTREARAMDGVLATWEKLRSLALWKPSAGWAPQNVKRYNKSRTKASVEL